MKQIFQYLGSGKTELVEMPRPLVAEGSVLIRTERSLVSSGTERMLLDFGKSSWIERARQQPDKVKQVLEKVRTDGILPTIEAVQSKLDEPISLGYCNAGVVVDVGAGVSEFAIGDRVASNGAHGEYVVVPKNLCVKIPDGVSTSSAAFTVMGAIALQGIRLAAPSLGETFVVIGLGPVGLLAVQLLKAQGCKVLGIDTNSSRTAMAREFGAEAVDLSAGADPIAAAEQFSRKRGVDGVLICASTASNEPVHQAATMCRKRGRIVLVGVTGLELSRADFYKKELSFQVSCSYGPGRYDPLYEDKGRDYPIGFVRWTEQRNFEAVLDMMADGRLNVDALISHRFAFNDALKAYDLLGSNAPSLGILLEYPVPEVAELPERTIKNVGRHDEASEKHDGAIAKVVVLGVIGAGNYATRTLLPAFKKAGVMFQIIASQGGASAAHAGRKFGFSEITTSVESVLKHPEVNAVVIATRHNTHAELVCRALRAGKHVFVEKPLAISAEQLAKVEQAYQETRSADGSGPVLMVGFNRRYSPLSVKSKQLLDSVAEPKAFVMTVNAGAIPADHWTQNPEVGGGRIIGEACHFVDLLQYLADSPIKHIDRAEIPVSGNLGHPSDNVTITLSFENGSIGTIHYFSNGHRSLPKERLEVFCAGKVLQLDNFRVLKGWGWKDFKTARLWRQDKGQENCARVFCNSSLNGSSYNDLVFQYIETTNVLITESNNHGTR